MSEVSTYEQHAIDFLRATNTQFTTKFKEFGEMWNDKQKRNIFRITLRNEKHKYSFDFGSSLHDSLENSADVITDPYFDFYSGLKFEGLKSKYLSYSAKIKIADLKNARNFNQCALLIDKTKAQKSYDEFKAANTNKYQQLNIISFNDWLEKIVISLMRKTTEFAAKNWGEGIPAKQIKHPSAYDVLACLTKYDPGTFSDFCSDFGYDEDSRSALKTYKAVKREYENLNKLFTPEELDLLQEIQ